MGLLLFLSLVLSSLYTSLYRFLKVFYYSLLFDVFGLLLIIVVNFYEKFVRISLRNILLFPKLSGSFALLRFTHKLVFNLEFYVYYFGLFYLKPLYLLGLYLLGQYC